LSEKPDRRKKQSLRDHEGDPKADEPMERSPFLKSDIADLVANRSERMVTLDHCRDKTTMHFSQFAGADPAGRGDLISVFLFNSHISAI
jgi:hypothetical protein